MPSVCRWLFRHVLSSAGLSSSCSSSGVFPRGPSLGDLLLLCVQPCPVPGSPPRRSAVSAASSRLPALEPFRESLGQASSREGKGAQDGACEAGVGTGRHAEVATRLGPTGFPAAGPGEAGRKAALARGVAGPGCCCARRIERRRQGARRQLLTAASVHPDCFQRPESHRARNVAMESRLRPVRPGNSSPIWGKHSTRIYCKCADILFSFRNRESGNRPRNAALFWTLDFRLNTGHVSRLLGAAGEGGSVSLQGRVCTWRATSGASSARLPPRPRAQRLLPAASLS